MTGKDDIEKIGWVLHVQRDPFDLNLLGGLETTLGIRYETQKVRIVLHLGNRIPEQCIPRIHERLLDFGKDGNTESILHGLQNGANLVRDALFRIRRAKPSELILKAAVLGAAHANSSHLQYGRGFLSRILDECKDQLARTLGLLRHLKEAMGKAFRGAPKDDVNRTSLHLETLRVH